MNAPLTLAAYATALGLVFGAAVAAGAAVGPVGTAAQDRPEHEMNGSAEQSDTGH